MSIWRALRTWGHLNAPTIGDDLNLPALRYSLRMVDEDTLEVQRFDNGWLRLGAWFCFFLLMYFVVLSWWEQSILWDNIQIWLNPEAYFRKQYDFWVQQDGGTRFTGTFSTWYQDMMEMHSDRGIGGAIFLALPTFFFIAACIWPRYRPIRFNRKLGIAYTWSWRRFFLSRSDPSLGLGRGVGDFDLMLRRFTIVRAGVGSPESHSIGALVLRLRHHRWTRYKESWTLGVFPPACFYQNSQISIAISDFLTNPVRPDWCEALERQPSPLSWAHRLALRVVNFSLLPAWWPRRTQKMIRRHLEIRTAEEKVAAEAREALRRRANGMD
ncbi:hypothetical protein [Rhodovulum sulfidophilum]|uniref:hypothetical protein n=1 Tax=Rhodovulum sulfidophilum TaxID=35806 RepID=UPI001F3D448E|nr:hypothetical protein [Rhodovulum sulfidophilum]MCE8439350.1 hypothetical protein [Rhodovulum sulfidophilum]